MNTNCKKLTNLSMGQGLGISICQFLCDKPWHVQSRDSIKVQVSIQHSILCMRCLGYQNFHMTQFLLTKKKKSYLNSNIGISFTVSPQAYQSTLGTYQLVSYVNQFDSKEMYHCEQDTHSIETFDTAAYTFHASLLDIIQ